MKITSSMVTGFRCEQGFHGKTAYLTQCRRIDKTAKSLIALVVFVEQIATTPGGKQVQSLVVV